MYLDNLNPEQAEAKKYLTEQIRLSIEHAEDPAKREEDLVSWYNIDTVESGRTFNSCGSKDGDCADCIWFWTKTRDCRDGSTHPESGKVVRINSRFTRRDLSLLAIDALNDAVSGMCKFKEEIEL